MSADVVVLVAAAVGLSVISGTNDGGTLLALSLRVPALRVSAVVVVAALLVAVPLLLGTAVATTLASRLVAFQHPGAGTAGRVALAVAILSGAAVVGVLARLGLPTSLTLALIGGIAGAGVGFDLPVSWATVGFVLLVGALAPAAGAGCAYLLARLSRLLPAASAMGRRVRWAHGGAFALLAVAYAANDGQKMLAVFAVALGTAGPAVTPHPGQLLAIALLFTLGALLGVRRIAGTVGTGLLRARPFHVVAAEAASAVAVLGSTAVGAPVSMTQTVAGGLVGSGVSQGYGRVRWRAALSLALAWTLTLPSAAAVAAVWGLLLRGLLP